MIDSERLSEIFKTEYSNLIAVLSHYYGVTDIQLAEDIVSETFIKAMKSWSHKGIPQYPKAWLRKVAQNHYLEEYRRKKVFEDKVSKSILNDYESTEQAEITEEIIEDSQLQMIFVLCDPELNNESQLCIALRILCGFTTEEIAKALLSNQETINKKLYRAKKLLREKLIIEKELTHSDYSQRLDNVLRVIYLLFNEGYYSNNVEMPIRYELCWEAMRLGIFLARQKQLQDVNIDFIQALVALMCFHASRFNARHNDNEGLLLFHEQDQSQWNQELIKKGQFYLKLASKGDKISKYHIEATIAYWHTQEHEDKWSQILMLYNILLTIEHSSIIAMNRCYALAKARSPKVAIQETLKLNLSGNHHYFCLFAELYKMDGNTQDEIKYLNKALQLIKNENEKGLIERKLNKAILK